MRRRTLVITPIISPIPKKFLLRMSVGRKELRRRGMLERKNQWYELLSLREGSCDCFRSWEPLAGMEYGRETIEAKLLILEAIECVRGMRTRYQETI